MASALAVPLEGSSRSSSSVSKSGFLERLLRLTGGNDYVIAPRQSARVATTPLIVDENARLQEIKTIQILQELEGRLNSLSYNSIMMEHDIWAPMPPKSEFNLNTVIEFEGRANPTFFADWVEED